MATWLIAFRCSTGTLERFEEFTDPDVAAVAQDRAKRARGRKGTRWRPPDLEIVTITAASPETLRKYHGRYFAKADAALAEHSRLSQEIENLPEAGVPDSAATPR